MQKNDFQLFFELFLFSFLGDMQLIAEAYHLMKDVIGLSHREMADTFSDWNRGVLDSFLIEITANILRYKVKGFRNLQVKLEKHYVSKIVYA